MDVVSFAVAAYYCLICTEQSRSTISRYTMIKVLTPKEVSFLLEMAELMKKYSVSISTDGTDGIEILVYETAEKTADSEDPLPISFDLVFDESDIYDLCLQTSGYMERIKTEDIPAIPVLSSNDKEKETSQGVV